MQADPFGPVDWEKNPKVYSYLDSPRAGATDLICHPEFAWRHIKSTHNPLLHVIRYSGATLEVRRSTFTPHLVTLRKRSSGYSMTLQLRNYDNIEKGQFYGAIEIVANDGCPA